MVQALQSRHKPVKNEGSARKQLLTGRNRAFHAEKAKRCKKFKNKTCLRERRLLRWIPIGPFELGWLFRDRPTKENDLSVTGTLRTPKFPIQK